MRKLIVRLEYPLSNPANNKMVSELFTKIARDQGLETRGMRWEYSQTFSEVFPYIIDRLMGWEAYPHKNAGPRLLLRLSQRGKPLIEIWQQVQRLRKK